MSQDLRQWLGNRIRALRVKRGLSQSDLAQQAGVGGETVVSRYERGKRLPRIDHLMALARVLGVTVSDLVGDARPATQAPETVPPVAYAEWAEESDATREELTALASFVWPDRYKPTVQTYRFLLMAMRSTDRGGPARGPLASES